MSISFRSIILRYMPSSLKRNLIAFRNQYNRCKKRYENYRECIQFELSKKKLAKDMSVKHAQLRQEIKKKSKVKIIF